MIDRFAMSNEQDLPELRTLGVLGAGQMGGGIAQVAAQAGYDVRLADASLELATRGRDKVGGGLARLVDKNKMTAEVRDGILARIQPVSSPADFAGCDLVIEAATENLDLKLKLLKAVDQALAPSALLATNTSSISVTKLAAGTSRPAQVVGMHFFNPPPLMKLVEVVRGVQTSDRTHAAIAKAAEAMGKTVVTTKDSPGFVVNRLLIPMLCEAAFALQEGVSTLAEIDAGVKLGLNHPMGPFELSDLIGLDTVLLVADVLHRDFGDDKYRAPTLLRNLVAAGWYGKKTGRGFYVYDDKGNKT